MADQLIAQLRDQFAAALGAGSGGREQLARIGRQLDQLDERLARLEAENALLRLRRSRSSQERCSTVPEWEQVKNRLLIAVPGAGGRQDLRVDCPVCHRQAKSMEGIFNYSCSSCGWVADCSREDLEVNLKDY